MEAYIESDNELIELLKFYGLIMILIIGYLVHIIIHEAGHLIFGLMAGYSFVSFRVGSFTLIKEDNKFKWKKFNIPGTAGQCLMKPPALKEGKYPFIIYNLGGALMNFIVSIVAILAAVFIENIASPLDVILILFGIGGILAGLTNAIPMKIGGISNDGYNILSVLKDEEARKGFYLQLKVSALQSEGVRIKNMPLENFTVKGDLDLSNPLNTSIKLIEYAWYLDNMDLERAKECIDSLIPYLDKIIPVYKYEINCERIFLELVGNCNKAFIDELYDKNLKKYIKASKYMIGKKRIHMAYEAFYNEDKDKALKRYEEGKKMVRKYPIKGETDMELMLLQWLKDKCKC